MPTGSGAILLESLPPVLKSADFSVAFSGADLVFFKAVALALSEVKDVVLFILLAIDLEVVLEVEATASLGLLVGFTFSSSANDGSFSGHDLRMFS